MIYGVLQNIQDVQHNCDNKCNKSIDPILMSTQYTPCKEDDEIVKQTEQADVIDYTEIDKMFQSLEMLMLDMNQMIQNGICHLLLNNTI